MRERVDMLTCGGMFARDGLLGLAAGLLGPWGSGGSVAEPEGEWWEGYLIGPGEPWSGPVYKLAREARFHYGARPSRSRVEIARFRGRKWPFLDPSEGSIFGPVLGFENPLTFPVPGTFEVPSEGPLRGPKTRVFGPKTRKFRVFHPREGRSGGSPRGGDLGGRVAPRWRHPVARSANRCTRGVHLLALKCTRGVHMLRVGAWRSPRGWNEPRSSSRLLREQTCRTQLRRRSRAFWRAIRK